MAGNLLGRLRRAAADRRGASALEFVLILPLLTLMLIAGADLGNSIQQSIRLETAARAGAQFALSFPEATACAADTGPTPSGIDANCIQGQVRRSLIGWADIAVANPVLRCVCPGNAGVTCTNEETCTDINGQIVYTEQYITVSVTRPHRPLLFSPFPTIEGRAEIRLR